MKYILVENGNIVGNPMELPRNWANISNFYLFDNETLKQYGWYPFRFVEAEINSNQFYDGSDFVIEENEVVEYQKVRNKTPQEIEAIISEKVNKEFPKPLGGFETELEYIDWKLKQEERFAELCRDYESVLR
jgi:hypothetical protein